MPDHIPVATIVVPAYKAAATIAETLESLLAQTFADFEIVVVDDGSPDETVDVVRLFADPRIRIVRQKNRGLAGAHNTGVHEARGEFVGFCDADDLWVPEKLERHIEHLRASPDVGISFSGSRMIDLQGRPLGVDQRPKLKNITAADIFKRNPIGNGSAAVMRRAALDEMAFRPFHETERDWWFDETFRQSDDIEGWLRFVTTLDWKIEGIADALTLYRIHSGGLSADTDKQFETWLRMRAKIEEIVPDLAQRHSAAAAAYQLRYLARRAVSGRDGRQAWRLSRRWLATSRRPLIEEPVKSVVTLAAALVLRVLGSGFYGRAEERLLASRRTPIDPQEVST